MGECRSLQQEEFEVLESIYPECISSQLAEGMLKLEVPVEFGSMRDVIITRHAHLSDDTSEVERLSVATLPPLLVHILLPPTYPLHEPPRIISIRATHLWLPRINLLSECLTEMWQAGEGSVYIWLEYLRTGEFMGTLGLVQEGSVIMIEHPNPPLLASLIASHEVSSKSSQFAKNTYPCSVCLTPRKGSKCLQLSCEHIFCRLCLQDFWGLCIEEGDINRVGCPDPSCVKQKREANEEEVARIVSDEEAARWRWLREKRDLDNDPTIVHCPIDVCQAAVMKPTNEDSESGWARFRQCSKCMFSFCSFCRKTWHGAISPCVMADSEEVVEKYLAVEEGSVARELLEQRYGRNNLRRLVIRSQEEKANKAWLHKSTTQCPGCLCRVEKSMGCNHMTCWKCGKHFCYRCGAAISGLDPYAHFSQRGGCYQRLFDYGLMS